MNTLLFPLVLLLPWLAGAMVLRPARERLGLTPAGWLGYGYFVGAVLLTASALLAAFLPWLATATGLILCLIVLTLITGFGVTWTAQFLPAATPLILPSATRRERWLTALLLILIALHLGFSLFELYWRPVYPWDAWQTWLYTAKAWYYNGAPVDMLSPVQWFNFPEDGSYTVQGHHYPWLVPAQSWWLATVLGSWQENRVVWPALPAAIALGLALWGQTVAATRQRLAGPLVAFLLLSLPLLHTHVSLAGYADLWLAGFSGLGLIALVRGLLEKHRGQLVLGLAALVLGMLVKHDAIIWWTCGLLLVGLLRLRLTATTLVLAGLLVLSAIAFGLWRLELQLHNDFARYGQLLWFVDSWHLLWYLLPGALLLALLPGSPVRPAAKVLGLLLAILLASQVFLFGATNAGNWVGTASSRLLLQISPLLIFALAYIAGASVDSQPVQRWGRSALAVLAGSLCLLLLLGGWLLFSAGINSKPVPAADFKAQQLRVILGPMRHLHTRLEMPPATDGQAIISSGPVRLDAASFDLVEVDIDSADQSQQTLFWRTAANPAQPFVRDLVVGTGQVTLNDDSDWQGEIIELGMVLYPDSEKPLTLRGLRFEQATPWNLMRLAANDWISPRFWTQISINRTELGATSGLPTLPLLAGLWVLFTWVALRLLTGAAPPLRPLLAVALFAWLLLDARWLHNSIHQALATQAHYANTADREALELGGDAAIQELARQARAALGQSPRRVLLVSDDEHPKRRQFPLRRLKYALLPHAAHIRNSRVSQTRAASVDAVITLFTGKPGGQAKCPPPLQRIKPTLVTSRGLLCIRSAQPSDDN